MTMRYTISAKYTLSLAIFMIKKTEKRKKEKKKRKGGKER